FKDDAALARVTILDRELDQRSRFGRRDVRPRVDQSLFVLVLALIRSSPRPLPPHPSESTVPASDLHANAKMPRPHGRRLAPRNPRIVLAFGAALQLYSRSRSSRRRD